jgi:hypothetical protein
MTEHKPEMFIFVWTTIVGIIGFVLLLIGGLLLWLGLAMRWSDLYVAFFFIGPGAVLLTISIVASKQQSSRLKSKK